MILVDIQSGARTEGIRYSDPAQFFEELIPIDDRNLLLAHYARDPLLGIRLASLARVEFPSYRELIRVEIPHGPNGLRISADQKLLWHGSNDKIVLRSTSDLSAVWEHRIEDGFVAAAHVDYVAFKITRSATDDQPLPSPYISIHERNAGAEVARLRIPEGELAALSPDGKLLAVVFR